MNIVTTLLRGFPLPCKTGVIKIGNPNKNSPVFLTANFVLTAQRVKKALNGTDCYLLVANSRGINVWCSAAGGYFTNHDVISSLKVSGIEKLVTHRNVVLPQLAAAGIESRVISEKTGWNVIWGPVYAKDIPKFMENEFRKTPQMREVKFPLMQRIEIAVMWAFPFSIIAGLITTLFWRNMVLPLISLIWALPFLIFMPFPLYSNLLNPQKKGTKFSKYTVVFDFNRVPLILEGIVLFCLIIYSVLAGTFTWEFILRWGFISFVVTLMISIDLMGSTPVYKSGLHEERFLKVVLNDKKCDGCGFCKEVCPKNCYEIDKIRHLATMPRLNQCVQCGACIVQCPQDALCFQNSKGEIISPEVLRKFKLNLMGKRAVKIERR